LLGRAARIVIIEARPQILRFVGVTCTKCQAEGVGKPDDIVSENGRKRAGFPAQVRIRLMLDLLQTEMAPEKPQEIEYLAGLDARLRAAGQAGSFVWEPNLAACFPENPYWYLYIHL
jgi:hypothetical protein